MRTWRAQNSCLGTCKRSKSEKRANRSRKPWDFQQFAWISNNSFACTTKFGSEYFLYSYFNFENFSDCISGSAQPQITFTALKNKIMQYPVSSDAVELFSDCTKTLLCKQFNNEQKSQTLTKLRDVLLPKLISGELRIPQAEKMVEEAVA